MYIVLVNAIQLLLQPQALSIITDQNTTTMPSSGGEGSCQSGPAVSRTLPICGNDASTLNNQYVRVVAEIRTR